MPFLLERFGYLAFQSDHGVQIKVFLTTFGDKNLGTIVYNNPLSQLNQLIALPASNVSFFFVLMFNTLHLLSDEPQCKYLQYSSIFLQRHSQG
jgi:hypothetical protein